MKDFVEGLMGFVVTMQKMLKNAAKEKTGTVAVGIVSIGCKGRRCEMHEGERCLLERRRVRSFRASVTMFNVVANRSGS